VRTLFRLLCILLPLGERSREADGPSLGFLSGGFDEMLDRLEHSFNPMPLLILAPFELVQALRQFVVSSQQIAAVQRFA
jgi:hypothetical protein